MMLVLSWQELVVFVAAVCGGVGVAMWGWFSVHGDLRTRDGLKLTLRESWQHIVGLLAYFVMGLFLFGGVSVLVLELLSHFR